MKDKQPIADGGVSSDLSKQTLTTETFQRAHDFVALQQRLDRVKLAITCLDFVIIQQAQDMGLWVPAKTAVEAYLQQELRRLHDVGESVVNATRV